MTEMAPRIGDDRTVNRTILTYATVLMGVLACLLFVLSVYVGMTDRLPFASNLWSGPDRANSQSQILWVLAAIPGVVFFLVVTRHTAFDHVRIPPVFSNIWSGLPLGRVTALVWAALIMLGSGSCVANIAVQIADRYVNPSCFYQSPC